jgi:hypothetical protein
MFWSRNYTGVFGMSGFKANGLHWAVLTSRLLRRNLIHMVKTIKVLLKGLRPMLFDRYPGDNNTKLSPEDKLYLSKDKQLVMPALNLFSLLTAENTKSACRMFFGKQGTKIAHGIKSSVLIEPFEIPICDEMGPIVFSGFDGNQLEVVHHVARMKKGSMAVPNPKERPQLNLPWSLQFNLSYFQNDDATLSNIRQAIAQAGTLGLGTFRPFFGTFCLEAWEEISST